MSKLMFDPLESSYAAQAKRALYPDSASISAELVGQINLGGGRSFGRFLLDLGSEIMGVGRYWPSYPTRKRSGSRPIRMISGGHRKLSRACTRYGLAVVVEHLLAREAIAFGTLDAQVIARGSGAKKSTYLGRMAEVSGSSIIVPRRGHSNFAQAEARRKLILTLMDDNWLGLRLLVELEMSSPMSPAKLVSAVTDARSNDIDSYNHVSAALLNLKHYGAIDVRYKGVFSTDWGIWLVRWLERETGIRLESQIKQEGVQDALINALLRVPIPTEVSAMKVEASGAALAPVKSVEELRSEIEKKDPNYRAYRRDAAALEAEHGKCIVAYEDGELVAVAKTPEELAAKIREMMPKLKRRGRGLFIKNIPGEEVEDFNLPY